MDTKLTLKLDKNVIESAKRYAQKHNVSLSQMVEKYFRALIEEKKDEKVPLSPIVKELSGVIKHDPSSDYRSDYLDYLEKKYR